jgi:hypothetical protein
MGDVQKFGKGPFDKAIVEGFSRHLSAEDVSANPPIMGMLSPAQCLDRLNKILASRDILDAATLAKLNLEDAYFLRNKLRDQMEKMKVIDKDTAAMFIKSIDAVQTRVEKSTKGYEDAMIRMQEMHARVMMQAIKVSYAQVAVQLQQEFSIPPERAYAMLEEALPLALESLEAEVVD